MFLSHFSHTNGWAVVLLCLFALCIGSFINVVAHRLPIMLQRQWAFESQHQCATPSETPNPLGDTFNLAQPRSHCPKCGEQLKVLDNLPLISWLWLKGRCRFCQEALFLTAIHWLSLARWG